MCATRSIMLLLASASIGFGYISPLSASVQWARGRGHALASVPETHQDGDKTLFALDVDLGESGVAKMKFKPKVQGSTAVVVKYPIPFGLDAEPVPGEDYLCVKVTKDGAGGEKIGDILRFTTSWSMGQIEGSGLLSTVGNFGGAPSWRLSMFDVAKASSFNEVVEALTSNEPRRGTQSVTLVFERPPDVE